MVIQYPIDPTVDYRKYENRHHQLMAWVEANAITQEHNQQLRLMNDALENLYSGVELLESKLWLAFLWGCCYNFVSPWAFLNKFPTPPSNREQFQELKDWYNETFEKQKFDTDCRYRKAKMLACIESYLDKTFWSPQYQTVIDQLLNEGDEGKNFRNIWDWSMDIKFYGRLSAWNYVEAVSLVTNWDIPLDAPDFMLRDVSNSESNINGACFLSNNDHLVIKKGRIKETGEKITQEQCGMLETEIEAVFQECKKEFDHITPITRLNFETTGACWNKKRFRNYQTRYIGWDAERTHDEILFFSKHWPELDHNTHLIWSARKKFLPEFLLNEEIGTEGVQKWKMPYFYDTGCPMDIYKFQQGEVWLPKRKSTPKLF